MAPALGASGPSALRPTAAGRHKQESTPADEIVACAAETWRVEKAWKHNHIAPPTCFPMYADGGGVKIE